MITRQLDGHNAAQHPIDLPAPGVEAESAVTAMYEDGDGRDPSPPGAVALQKTVRRIAVRTLPGAGRSLPPPGVERSALAVAADVTAGIRSHRLGPSDGRHAYMPIGAAYPEGIQRPPAPRRGNTFRRRPDPYNTAQFVNLVPARV